MEDMLHILLVCEADLPDSNFIWKVSCRAQKDESIDICYDLPSITQSSQPDHKYLNRGVSVY